MPSYVQWSSSDALVRRLKEIQDAARPGSRAVSAARKDIRQLIIDDNTDKFLRGVDRYGKPMVRLAASTLKRRDGSGPPLIPHGTSSRFITHFEANWVQSGGYSQLQARYRDINDSKGRPFAQYHMTGCPIGSNPKRPNWSLPRRDPGGITPKGWYRVIQRHKQLAEDIRKSGGGR